MSSPDLSLRTAGPADAAALRRLAELDSVPPLAGPVLLAEQDGRVVAALSTADGRVAADPFERTALAADLLRLRARQERPARRGAALRPVLGT